jgi:aryl carrier-like protein
MAGELCIAGDGVARGYLNSPELTAEKFVDNPFGEGKMYRSGDLARWLSDGNIEFLGRIDEQIKLRGFRIELAEIEAVIRKINGVQDVTVIMREENGEKHICAYIVAGEELEVGNIREELRKELPDYMVPAYMMKLEKLPVTANGKLDKRALPQIEIKSEQEYVAPRNEMEEAIVQLFREVLGIEKIGLKDNFFELGGDSIKAIRVVSKLRGLDYQVTMREIIQQPSIELIIAKVAEKNNQYLTGNEAATTSGTSAKKLLAEEKGLEISTVAVLEDKKFDPQNFKEKKIYKELMDYDHNMSNEAIIDSFEPFAYQKYFLVDDPYNVCCAKTIINGSVDPEKLKQISREIIKEQSICRWSYCREDNCYLEYSYTGDWHVPYIDLTKCEQRSEELRAFESISSISTFFSKKQLLAKILIVKIAAEKHFIYFYAQHAVWDFLSTEVLGNLIINKFLSIDDHIIKNEYTEYVKLRKKREDNSQKDSHAFVDRFLNMARNYEEVTRGKTMDYLLDVKYKMKPGQVDEILKNPIQWGVKLLASINIEEPSEAAHQTIPLILIRFSRENTAHTTLGLYLNLDLQVVNTNGWSITPSQNSQYSNALFEHENMSKELRNNYFGKISLLNFVTAFDSAYQFDDFGEFKMEIKKMPEMVVVKGYTSIRIINDVLHLIIPSFENEWERIESVVRGYLEQS